MPEDVHVLRANLSKAEARVEHDAPATNTCCLRSGDMVEQLVGDGANKCLGLGRGGKGESLIRRGKVRRRRVYCKIIHSLRRASHVHKTYGGAELRDGREHLGIHGASRDVVDHICTGFDRSPGHR